MKYGRQISGLLASFAAIVTLESGAYAQSSSLSELSIVRSTKPTEEHQESKKRAR